MEKKMKFNIEKGIPMPTTSGKPRKYDLPLDEMEVGDHIKIELPKTKIDAERKILSNFCLRHTYKNPSKKFSVRKLEDGVGIWRIK
jgi:hypothetical protein|tara:strand:- start:875 stop:1132 length:258 start_codon:yes stop_codon:yes gene_type:complete